MITSGVARAIENLRRHAVPGLEGHHGILLSRGKLQKIESAGGAPLRSDPLRSHRFPLLPVVHGDLSASSLQGAAGGEDGRR